MKPILQSRTAGQELPAADKKAGCLELPTVLKLHPLRGPVNVAVKMLSTDPVSSRKKGDTAFSASTICSG